MNLDHTRTILKSTRINPDLLDVCLDVTNALEGLDEERGSFLTYSFFVNSVDNLKPGEKLLAALNFLSTFEYAILDAHAYLDGDRGEPIILSDKTFHDMAKTGILVHPDDGEIVKDPMSKVRLFFSLRSEENLVE